MKQMQKSNVPIVTYLCALYYVSSLYHVYEFLNVIVMIILHLSLLSITSKVDPLIYIRFLKVTTYLENCY